ncbi:hypothetical protein [Acetobacter syzygii]|nr:hypothetical protein [Acetobacter syzygii]
MDEYKNYYGTEPATLCPQLFNTNTHLPIRLHDAYRLCMTLHDEMLKILHNGIEHKAFSVSIPLDDSLKTKLENSNSHILDWMKENGLDSERAMTICLTVLPAVMRDMLNCIFESLEMARKGKMSLAFMLIRKPIQENLFLIEEIIISPQSFVENFENNLRKLQGTGIGGVSLHAQRLEHILKNMTLTELYDAQYLAQLRYDKNSSDNLDGICNQSIHLFTLKNQHIKTEKLNINMIFSKINEIDTQSDFYFSRIVYITSYIYDIISHIGNEIVPTTDEYKIRINNVIEALTAMWFIQLPEKYTSKEIYNFCLSKTKSLKNDLSYKECVEIINNWINQK